MHADLPLAVFAHVFVFKHAALDAGVALVVAQQEEAVPAALGGLAIDGQVDHRMVDDLGVHGARRESLLATAFMRRQVVGDRLARP